MQLIRSCDLIISICQTAVHMAGSMGVPCWVLVPDARAWRYVNPEHPDEMPWYKSVRMINQNGRPWEEIVAQTRQQLVALTSG